MTRLLSLVSAFLLAAQVGPAAAFTFPWQHPEAEPAPPRPVVSEILDDRPQRERSVPGVVTSKIEVVLGFQTLGRLIERRVDVGDTVSEGALLAALDPDDLQGNVAAATAAVEAAEVNLKTAQSTAERTRALVARNVSSAAQLEQVENALVSAQATFQQANSELNRARDAEGYAKMNAPFAGVISDVYANAGAVVSAGAPVLKLSADDQLEARIDLPETALVSVTAGDEFDVWSESAPQDIIRATVSLIEPVADAATRTRRVRLTLNDPDGLRLGTLIRARPATSQHQILSLPSAAILIQNDRPHVWVVSRQGDSAAVSLRAISTEGPAIGGRIAIASGLRAGEEVVTRGVHSLREGEPVGRSVAP
ncbi:efflux RND transporter periplasmic adaptor subunit [Paracoccus aminophilus]|uniref:RND family efflux transporter n=1 Tax=Paracoccus aminophilus JCM 7686 TaxID=1367847 RepID=S5XJS4_PARAH|nr:efflux RND transporter periplasmic adaptor subunit [Paracoccus aminophilus]AGT07439.1 RND family efflux transporter [Paracoccus aminophilus JCM 7686]